MPSSLTRKPVSLAALLALGAGLALTGVLAVWEASAEAARHRNLFEHAAESRKMAFQKEFEDTLQGLAVVNQLFTGSDRVDQQRFHDLSAQLVQLHPYIKSFSYVRILPGEERQAFEAQMRQKGDGLKIKEIRDGKLVPAAKRARYHVIEHIAPSSSAGLAGLDFTSVPGRDAALERARSTGQPSSTPLFDLLPEDGGERAFAILMPVYQTGARSATDKPIAGYTSVVLRATPFVQSVTKRAALHHVKDIDTSILVDDGAHIETVYKVPVADAEPGPFSGDAGWPADERPGGATHTVDAAGLRWLIVSHASPSTTAGMSASAWIVLGVGATISILFALYLQSVAVRAAYLADTNARLNRHIDTRKRIEKALRASEERFERLTRMSSDWYWEQDAEFRFTMISGETIFGDTPTKALLGKTRNDVPLEVDERDFEEYLQLTKSHQPFTDLEYRVRDTSGNVHWMSVSGEPMFDTDGTFLGYRGTGKDITQRKESEQALRQSQTELRELAAHQARVKEDERKRIAREIHDDLGQCLLALRIDVTLLESATRDRHPEINEHVHGLLSQVDNVVRSVRAIINDLRPPVLDLGLQCAVEWQVQQFRQRSGVSCTLEVDGADVDGVLDEEAATSVFRILQESLTNVSRHAYATHVAIRLQRKYDCLVLEIADDGIGSFPGNMRKPRSFGLIGIRERVFNMGGEFRVTSAPGKGTTLTISIPAAARSAAAA